MPTEIAVALIGMLGGVIIALIEKTRRENSRDHSATSDKLDMMGKSLGISIDRVEESVHRAEAKLDNHINDHAKGSFD